MYLKPITISEHPVSIFGRPLTRRPDSIGALSRRDIRRIVAEQLG